MATTNLSSNNNKKESSSNSRGLILLLFTSGFFVSGLLFDYMPMIVDNQIKRTIELATNEEIQSLWSRPPVEFHSYYWLYDILNAEKFLTGEEKIRVRRVGPYHFTSRPEKRILDISQNKYRITYNSTRHIYLDEANSVTLDEPLVLLNPVYASLAAAAKEFTRNQDAQTRAMMLSSAGRLAERFNETLFINITARSALLGRRLLIMEKFRKMAETFGFEVNMPAMSADASKNFGYVALINGTWSGPFEIYSGYQASMNSLGDVISYQGKKRLTEFRGKCNRLQTSAGELRPMPLQENQTLEMFQPNFCRIVRLRPTGIRKLKEGQTISYVLHEQDFASAQTNPDNGCFCLNETSNDYCSLNGALELGPCTYYSPIVVTVSNLRPDERITSSVQNWDPDMMRGDVELLPAADDHGQILILKRLGIPIQGDITLTLLMKVVRDPIFRQMSQVPEESFIPVLTVRERAQIPPKLGQIIINLESFLGLTTHLKVVMYLTAVVLLCSLTGHYYSKSSGKPRIGPSAHGHGEDGDDDDDRAARAAKGGQRNSSSMIGARSGARIAMPASGTPSDRANSADSNRSQPPSRVSHSSLDDEPTGGCGGGGGGDDIDDQRLDELQTGTTDSASQLIRPVTGSEQAAARPAPPQYRIFSKVEEAGGAARSNPGRPTRQANVADEQDNRTPNGLAGGSPLQSQPQPVGQAETDTVGTRKQSQGGGNSNSTLTTAGLVATTSDAQKQPARRNWFMKVCSNFVRMLNGIRNSINDAGQLDINENDYQDKQLEMLAGKIDSWYQSSPQTPDSSMAAGTTVAQADSGDSRPKDSSAEATTAATSTAATSTAATPAAAGTTTTAAAAAAEHEAEPAISAQATRVDIVGGHANEEHQGIRAAAAAATAAASAAAVAQSEPQQQQQQSDRYDRRRQRMNKDDEDDAGIGSESASASGSAAEDAPLSSDKAGTNSTPSNLASVRDGLRAPPSSVRLGSDQADQATNVASVSAGNEPGKANSGSSSDSSSTSGGGGGGGGGGGSSSTNNSNEGGGGGGENRSNVEEARETKKPTNIEREARTDSMQSNETVINKSNDTSGDESNASQSTTSTAIAVAGAAAATATAATAATAVRDTGRQPSATAAATEVRATAAAAAEFKKPAAQEDKAAFLDSMERALTTNSIEGY